MPQVESHSTIPNAHGCSYLPLPSLSLYPPPQCRSPFHPSNANHHRNARHRYHAVSCEAGRSLGRART
jgi:hypothetical protein